VPWLSAGGGGRIHAIRRHSDSELSQPRSDRIIAGLLFVGSLLVYVAVSRHKYVAYDASSMVGVTHDLVDHFSLQASPGFYDYLHLSTPYSPYGLGVSIIAVPFYALSKLTGNEMTILSMINPLIVATSVVFCYAIGRCLQWKDSLAVLAAVAFSILTMTLQSTTELFSEPAVGLCIAILVWGCLKWRVQWKPGPIVIGLAAGAVIQFRADSILTVWIGLLALPLFVPWRTILRPINLCALCIPPAVSLVALGAYNYVRWQSVLQFSYNGEGFHSPLSRGIEGFLFSPGKSLFVFNPLALLGVVGLGVLVYHNRAIGALFLLLIVPRLLFFAKWDSWQGGVDWGPRFLMPIVMVLVIAAVEVLHRTARHSIGGIAARGAFVVLSFASLGVSFVSVRVPYEQWVQVLYSPALSAPFDQGRPLVPDRARPDGVGNAYDFTLRASQIRGEVDLLQRGQAKMAPVFFGNDALIGWVVLSVGVSALVAAGLRAIGSDRSRADVPGTED
jgi:hypothetical protein